MIFFKNFTLYHGSKVLLENYSGHFSKNKFIGITGANGSGKTSLLRALSGLNTNYKGTLSINSKNLTDYSLKELSCLRTYVPAAPICHWSLSVQQLLSIENPFFETKKEILDDLNLCPLLSQNFKTLSSGEKARVFLAHALMRETDILILDEITSHLDDHYQNLVMQHLQHLAQKGKSIFLSIHQKNLAFSYCDHVLCLESQSLEPLTKSKSFLKEIQ